MKIKFCVTILVVIVMYFLRPYWMPAKIAGIFQGEDYLSVSKSPYNSTVVLVDNPPITRNGKLELWRLYEKKANGNFLILGDFDEIVFLRNKPERPYDSQELKYWAGDNQFCLKGNMNESCISKDEILFAIVARERRRDGEYIGDYNGMPLYIWYIER